MTPALDSSRRRDDSELETHLQAVGPFEDALTYAHTRDSLAGSRASAYRPPYPDSILGQQREITRQPAAFVPEMNGGRVPIVVRRRTGSELPLLVDDKFVVPGDTMVHTLARVLAKRLKAQASAAPSSHLNSASGLDAEAKGTPTAVALFVAGPENGETESTEGGITCPDHVTLASLYHWQRSPDGLLRLVYDELEADCASERSESPSVPAAEVFTLLVM